MSTPQRLWGTKFLNDVLSRCYAEFGQPFPSDMQYMAVAISILLKEMQEMKEKKKEDIVPESSYEESKSIGSMIDQFATDMMMMNKMIHVTHIKIGSHGMEHLRHELYKQTRSESVYESAYFKIATQAGHVEVSE